MLVGPNEAGLVHRRIEDKLIATYYSLIESEITLYLVFNEIKI